MASFAFSTTQIRGGVKPLLLRMLILTAFAALTTSQVKGADPVQILVLCTGNSARSQMTAGFLKSFDSKLDVYSAGTVPAPRINPNAVKVMSEVGIDISSGVPKDVRQFLGQSFDFVITVCDDADKNCPNFRGKVGKRVHIGFMDPAKSTGTPEEVLAVFRKVRDEIRTRFSEFYQKEIRPVSSARAELRR